VSRNGSRGLVRHGRLLGGSRLPFRCCPRSNCALCSKQAVPCDVRCRVDQITSQWLSESRRRDEREDRSMAASDIDPDPHLHLHVRALTANFPFDTFPLSSFTVRSCSAVSYGNLDHARARTRHQLLSTALKPLQSRLTLDSGI
jgi:hypothetical protein